MSTVVDYTVRHIDVVQSTNPVKEKDRDDMGISSEDAERSELCRLFF